MTITSPASAPTPQVYPPSSAEFRYWNATDALRRAADYWGALVPAGTNWHLGRALPVILDAGEDFNAFYDRESLQFFHGSVASQTVFSGDSPDVLCHELGHGVLDALQPDLWDLGSDEAAAFHESFGDMSALLSALQLDEVRKAVIAATRGQLYRASFLSRLAEQLGWAIRQDHPDAVDRDALRNAVNTFFYRDPTTLPPIGPAATLSSEPHSFSRVFTAAFYEALAGMLRLASATPTSAQLLQVTQDMGHLLVDGVLGAAVASEYYAQVASHMLSADAQRFSGKYRNALSSAFVRHGVLSLESAAGVTQAAGVTGAAGVGIAAAPVPPARSLPRVAISGIELGLGERTIMVTAPGEPRTLMATAAAPNLTPLTPTTHVNAAKAFLTGLYARGHIDLGTSRAAAAVEHPLARKSHKLVDQQGELVLQRVYFDCGLGR
jgi:hypothetical protein